MSVTPIYPQPLIGPTVRISVPLGLSTLRTFDVDRTGLDRLKDVVAAAETALTEKERQLREGPKPGTRGFYTCDDGRRFYCTALSHEQAFKLCPEFESATFAHSEDTVFILDAEDGTVGWLRRSNFTPVKDAS